MKTLTLTSEFFQNECAESFLKAILGNECIDDQPFLGYNIKSSYCPFISIHNKFGTIHDYSSVTFKLDDSFSVDWACLFAIQINERFRVCNMDKETSEISLNLDYLSTLQGVIIEESSK